MGVDTIKTRLANIGGFRVFACGISQAGVNAPVLSNPINGMSSFPTTNYIIPGIYTVDFPRPLADIPSKILPFAGLIDAQLGSIVVGVNSTTQIFIQTSDNAFALADGILTGGHLVIFVIDMD